MQSSKPQRLNFPQSLKFDIWYLLFPHKVRYQ